MVSRTSQSNMLVTLASNRLTDPCMLFSLQIPHCRKVSHVSAIQAGGQKKETTATTQIICRAQTEDIKVTEFPLHSCSKIWLETTDIFRSTHVNAAA